METNTLKKILNTTCKQLKRLIYILIFQLLFAFIIYLIYQFANSYTRTFTITILIIFSLIFFYFLVKNYKHILNFFIYFFVLLFLGILIITILFVTNKNLLIGIPSSLFIIFILNFFVLKLEKNSFKKRTNILSNILKINSYIFILILFFQIYKLII